ncbi:MAG: hypothetical protein U0163_09090 [Gemmatimonadaceae bacterium]
MTALRSIPSVTVLRPADSAETAGRGASRCSTSRAP